MQAMPAWHVPARDAWVIGLTDLGHGQGVIPLSVLLVLYSAARGQWRRAVFVAIAMAGSGVLNTAVKHVMARPRPGLWSPLVDESTWSFPSGHAMGSASFATVLVLLAWPGRWRWPVALAAGLFAVLVGLSRPYLGVHWPSDIVAAWLLGPAWVLAMYMLVWRQRGRDLCRSTDIS